MSESRKKSIPPAQRRWCRTYWSAFVVSALLLFYGVIQLLSGRVELTGVVASALGTSALAVGAVQAMRLSRAGVSDMWFVKGTTTTRTIAVGWLALAASAVLGSLVSVLFGVEFEIVASAGGILSTIGAVSLLAQIGPGYSEYREARDQRIDVAEGPGPLRVA